MIKLIDYGEPFCWRRRFVSYKEQKFYVIPGKDYTFKEKFCDKNRGFLVSESMIYTIPAELGVFMVFDLIFLINERGIFFEII